MDIEDKEEHLMLLNKAKEYFNQPIDNIWFDLKDETFKCNLRWRLTKFNHQGCYFVDDDRKISKSELKNLNYEN